MSPSRTNTAQGRNIEQLLINSLPTHRDAFGITKELAQIPANLNPMKSEVIGTHQRKTDVEFSFGDAYPLLRISVKSFDGNHGYNHLWRTSLNSFCRSNKIKKSDELFLQTLFLRKAKASKAKASKAKASKARHTKLVKDGEKGRIEQIFSPIEVGASAFLGSDHPQILALFNIQQSKWGLYSFQNTVLPLIRQQKIGFTKRGANIEIGEYVVFQRKGSQRGEQGISADRSIDDIQHRANDVQIKFRTKRFFEEVPPDAWYKLKL